MSDFDKIEEQEKILSSYNQNIVVSASAGSGKTSVMIRKIIDLILHKNVHIKNLLVLTYTNSAASEMKQKLINAMNSNAKDNPILLEEIDDIPIADISTVDSFCQKLVKRYFYILDIDPGFNIVQGTKQKQLQSKALKNAINLYKEQNSAQYFDLFNCFASNRTDKNIYEIVLNLYNYTCSILDYQNFKMLAQDLFCGTPNKACQILHKNILQEAQEIKQKCNKLIVLSKNMGFDNYVKYLNNTLSVVDTLFCFKNFEDLIEYAQNADLKTEPRQEEQDENIKPQITNAKETLKELLSSISKYHSKQTYLDSIEYCKSTTETLFELCDLFTVEYTKIKKKNNVYDYNDIERLTIKLFENQEILNKIKSNYTNIFIDEFQDANLVQEKIINCLKSSDNLFLVGDLKQAIYGFRQSNSKIFERICQDYEKENNINGKSIALTLNCNFRTTKNILEFINQVFSVIMTNKTAALDYKNKSKLNPKAKYLDELNHSVELNIFYQDKQDEQTKGDVYSVIENQNNLILEQKTEAQFVAERITKLLDEEIYDVNLKKYRKIKYSDVCLLFRTRASQNEFIEVFNRYNIPLVENSNEDLEQTYDIKVLINLIRVSQNYKNDYALASVMMSSLFDFSADQMFQIRKKAEGKYFYECVKNYNAEDQIKQKITNMFNLIANFRHKSTFNGLELALVDVLNETNYQYKISQQENSYSRIKNINDYVNSFSDSNFNFCISDYLNFLENNTREQKVISQVNSYDAVTLTTMHASKGLEWGVVFVVSLGSDFNHTPHTSKIELNEELGLGVKYYNKTNRKKYDSVFYDVIKQKNKQNDFSEKLRLLYVALTRAKNRLILVGETKSLKYTPFEYESQINSTSTYLDLIIRSLNNKDICNINNKVQCFNIYNNPNYICNVIDTNSYKQNINQIVNVLNLPTKTEYKNALEHHLSAEYFNKNAINIAQKNSVSSILQQDEYSSFNYSPKNLTISEHLSDISKNELGSLYHKVFELMDFTKKATIADINKILQQIINQQLFKIELINQIDKNQILKSIELIRSLVNGAQLIKEHSFVMQLKYNEINQSDVQDEVLVQGVCDLVAIKDNKAVLIDYKYSNLNNNSLIKKYKKQIYLYKKAIEYGFDIKDIDCFILSIKTATLIPCDV